MFEEKAEIFILLAVILILSAMGLAMYTNCGGCNDATSKNLYHMYISTTVISAAAIIGLLAYQFK